MKPIRTAASGHLPRPNARLRAALRLATIAAAGGALLAPVEGHAQAWFYPSFQVPNTVERDYTGGVVANGGGTGAIFQWREALRPGSQLSLDAGLVDSDDITLAFVGGQYAYELARTTPEQPLAILFTAGAGLAVGNGPDLFRLPVGVSLGHRFLLEGGMALTPYVHPRLSLDLWTGGRGSDGSTDLTIDFDIGASFEITPRLALRGSLLLSGADVNDGVGFGLGVVYTPAGLSRLRVGR